MTAPVHKIVIYDDIPRVRELCSEHGKDRVVVTLACDPRIVEICTHCGLEIK